MFSAYHIVADLKNSKLTFQPGCGCANNTSKYPQMFKNYKGLCAGNCDRNLESCQCEDIAFEGIDLPRKSKDIRSSVNHLVVLICLGLLLV
jgi:hypothetical protein